MFARARGSPRVNGDCGGPKPGRLPPGDAGGDRDDIAATTLRRRHRDVRCIRSGGQGGGWRMRKRQVTAVRPTGRDHAREVGPRTVRDKAAIGPPVRGIQGTSRSPVAASPVAMTGTCVRAKCRIRFRRSLLSGSVTEADPAMNEPLVDLIVAPFPARSRCRSDRVGSPGMDLCHSRHGRDSTDNGHGADWRPGPRYGSASEAQTRGQRKPI